MLKLNIKTGGAAYCDPFSGEEDNYCEQMEVAKNLRDIADELEHGRRYGTIIDINGNKVGSYELNQKGNVNNE